MKKIALSIEQMKHLKELGVDCSNASLYYILSFGIDPKEAKEEDYQLSTIKSEDECDIPAFTLQDIIEILPSYIKNYTLSIYYGSTIQYDKVDSCDGIEILQSACGDIILNNAYAILCWCAENGYLKQK